MAALFDLDGWYRRFGEAVLRRARRILGDDASARDALQETFLRAHRYAASYAGGSALVWLFTICDRVCFDVLKQRRRSPVASSNESNDDDDADFAVLAGEGPPSPGARLERDQLVRKALLRVDDETRQILLHRFFDELDTADIATALSTSERTVRRRLADFFSTARARLDREVRP